MKSFFNLSNNYFYSLILSLLAFFLVITFIVEPGINSYERALFEDMIYGKAHKPFVYRQLIPLLVRGTVAILPEGTDHALNSLVEAVPGVQAKFDDSGLEIELYAEYFSCCFFLWAALVAFGLSLGYLLRAFYRTSIAVNRSTVIVSMSIIPAFYDKANYIYDFPTLALFTLGLAFLAQRKLVWFLLIFMVGCVNKETIVLLTLICVLVCAQHLQLSKQRYYLWFALQIGIFAIIKTALHFIFKDNPGGMTEFHLMEYNLGIFGQIPLETVIAFGVVALLIFHDWQEKPLFLRKALWIGVPLFVLVLFFGYLDEQRDFYELYPVVIGLIFPTALKVLKVE